ncbi:hypothetical protein PIB30_108227, partial [Stylosanthes scabra]|nr:hypothetical protein [Stylosanthes scabra]
IDLLNYCPIFDAKPCLILDGTKTHSLLGSILERIVSSHSGRRNCLPDFPNPWET